MEIMLEFRRFAMPEPEIGRFRDRVASPPHGRR